MGDITIKVNRRPTAVMHPQASPAGPPITYRGIVGSGSEVIPRLPPHGTPDKDHPDVLTTESPSYGQRLGILLMLAGYLTPALNDAATKWLQPDPAEGMALGECDDLIEADLPERHGKEQRGTPTISILRRTRARRSGAFGPAARKLAQGIRLCRTWGIEAGGKPGLNDLAGPSDLLAIALETRRRLDVGDAALGDGGPNGRGDFPDPFARTLLVALEGRLLAGTIEDLGGLFQER